MTFPSIVLTIAAMSAPLLAKITKYVCEAKMCAFFLQAVDVKKIFFVLSYRKGGSQFERSESKRDKEKRPVTGLSVRGFSLNLAP